MSYGRNYDFSRQFFKQFAEIEQSVPVLALLNDDGVGSVNCEYTYDFAQGKNCYLVFDCWYVEDGAYSFNINYTKDVYDSYSTLNSERMYETILCYKSYNCTFSEYLENSYDCHFSYDLKGCSYCFLSSGLRNKRYCIKNKQYSQDNYKKVIRDYKIDSYQGQRLVQIEYQKIRHQALRKPSYFLRCVLCTGNDLKNCKNASQVFRYNDVVDSKYLTFGDTAENSYDVLIAGKTKQNYECNTTDNAYQARFSDSSWQCRDIHYSNHCHNSHNLFGCIGLRNKSYCILNKQYTKEEYEELVPKIIEHMNTMPYVSKIPNDKIQMSNQVQNPNVKTQEIIYRYGEFFPPELSPFAYNETIAQEYFPLTKDEAIAQGYRWKDREERNYEIDIKTEELPVHIKDVKDDIIGKVIECVNAKCQNPNVKSMSNIKGQMSNVSQCTTAFKIIEPELQFYRRMNLPLPRLCPNCRHYERLKQRNPLKLWHRKCQCNGEKSQNNIYQNTITHAHGTNPCPNEFETSYSPDRPEIVYCEECYKREVV